MKIFGFNITKTAKNEQIEVESAVHRIRTIEQRLEKLEWRTGISENDIHGLASKRAELFDGEYRAK